MSAPNSARAVAGLSPPRSGPTRIRQLRRVSGFGCGLCIGHGRVGADREISSKAAVIDAPTTTAAPRHTA